jgi:hypothetical protein
MITKLPGFPPTGRVNEKGGETTWIAPFKFLQTRLKLRLAFSSGWSRTEELAGTYLLVSHRLAASGSTTAHFPVESEM